MEWARTGRIFLGLAHASRCFALFVAQRLRWHDPPGLARDNNRHRQRGDEGHVCDEGDLVPRHDVGRATALARIDLDNPGTAIDRTVHPNPVPRVVGLSDACAR
jgi:hypothetical protein